jgi:hypothetical protein
MEQRSVPRVRRRREAALSLILAALVGAPGCGDAEPRAWGAPVSPEAAVTLSALLDDAADPVAGPVTVSGRIGEVCRSSGCWFVLQELERGKLHEIVVDLKPAATFTVPASVQGRDVVVRGELVGTRPDLQLNAVGMRLE